MKSEIIKTNILMYGLIEKQKNMVTMKYGKNHEVTDTDCFTDLLAIPAMLIYIGPEEVSISEMKQLDELFKHDADTIIVFTHPLKDDVVKALGINEFHDILEHFSYYVAEDLEHVSSYSGIPCGGGEFVSGLVKNVKGYPGVLHEKDNLLRAIEKSIMPNEDIGIADKAPFIREHEKTYRHLLDLVEFGDCGPVRRKVPFRYEVINLLLALKLAYGLIRPDDSVLTKTGFIGSDNDWIISLAEQLKKRKEKSKFLSAVK